MQVRTSVDARHVTYKYGKVQTQNRLCVCTFPLLLCSTNAMTRRVGRDVDSCLLKRRGSTRPDAFRVQGLCLYRLTGNRRNGINGMCVVDPALSPSFHHASSSSSSLHRSFRPSLQRGCGFHQDRWGRRHIGGTHGVGGPTGADSVHAGNACTSSFFFFPC